MSLQRFRTMVGAVLLVLPAACGPEPAASRLVRITVTPDSAVLLSYPALHLAGYDAQTAVAWLRPERLLLAPGGGFPYQSGDSDSLSLVVRKWSIELDGRVVSLNLGHDSALRWLAGASTAEMAGLRLLDMTDTSLTAAGLSALERCLSANPDVGLSFDNRFLPGTAHARSRARLLSITNVDSTLLASLSLRENLEILYASDWDSSSGAIRQALPRLRYLMADPWVAPRLAANSSRLEQLATGGNDTLDIGALGRLPRLTTLHIEDGYWKNAGDLSGLPRLREISFAKNATQAEFETIIRAHPDLELIVLHETGDVTDLAPLRGLRRLRALSLDDHPTRDLGVLRELPSLEFVGLADDIWDKQPEKAAAIRAGLPGVTVAYITPFCLGSGWILLLVPAALLVTMRGRRLRAA